MSKPKGKKYNGKIINWKPTQGFGFIFHRGHRVFVHRSKLKPTPKQKNEDLEGYWINFLDTDIVVTKRKLMDANLKERVEQEVLELMAGTLLKNC